MNINKSFKSQFLKAADLDDEDKIVTITSLSIEEVGQDKDEKPVLYFEEFEAGLVLNKTNANTIASMYGTETDDWTGKRLTLFSTMVDFGGKSVEAIRVKGRPPKAAAAPAQAPQRTPDAPPAKGRPGQGAPSRREALKPPPQGDEWDEQDPVF